MSTNETTLQDNSTSGSLLKVYLRLRDTKEHNDVYYVDTEDPVSLVATAPENSETHKNSHRNHTLSVQKFKFSKIFVPSTTQPELFESTALPLLDECLNLENNALLFTYGVTASGKTHTVQGPRHDAGLLPRSLDLIFNSLGSHIKPRSMFCPHLHSEVCKMTEKLQHQNEQRKQRILYPANTSQDLEITGLTDPNSTRCTIGSMTSECTAYENTSYQITDNVLVQLSNPENIQYSVWVSYLELYNENVYDLLQPPPEQGEMKPRDRQALRLGEDHKMSVYVKGATQLEVCSFAEANRALMYGQRNRKKAATSMNQSSSRSHAIFKITVIATNTISQQSKCSQITFVDLAGSERYGKTNTAGVRLKEAGNINTSLLTLGKCISSLKHNSKLRPRQATQAQIVPFRESKLTRLFKNFLSGEGLITMIVCVNPHKDFFDESIHALKFSALATEALLLPRPPSRIEQTSTSDEKKMSELDLQQMKYEIRQEVLVEVQQRIKRMRKNHEEDLAAQKEREVRYQEGVEAGLQQYYKGVIDELKKKVRDARAQNGNTGSKESQEKITKKEETITVLKKQCQDLDEELQHTRSEHKLFKAEIDQQLFQTKLELKTTQQLYHDGNQEKERFANSISEKENEIKRMFQDLEEATKLSTFWEKECNDLKAANAQQIERLQCQLKEGATKQHRLETEITEKTDVIQKITKESLQKDNGKQELEELRKQVEAERQIITQTNSEKSQLQSDLRTTQTKLEEMRGVTQQDKKDIALLKDNCTEYTTLISNLKSQLETLQQPSQILSSQESKENKENKENQEPDSLRSRLTAAQEQVQEKNKLISELEEELGDIVRNKSLQFDTLICNKEKECEELQATLSRKDEIISNTNNKLQDLESMMNSQNQKILELQDLASVQKEHLSSVELGAKDDVERLKLEIEQLQGGKSENSTLTTENTAELERQVNKLRVGCELNKQEADRVKVELAAAQRKMTDELKKYKDTIDAKDIELKNWYDEKEKAVKMISNKKEKEISALEKLLEDKDMLIKNLEQNTVATVAVNCPSPAMGSEEYTRLSEESKRKLTEMADMVIQMETDRDETRAEYEKFKSQIDEAISEKETKFAELRVELASTETRNKELQDTVSTALARSIELEQTVSELKREMESMELKRSKNVSVELDEGGRDSTQSSRSSNRVSNKPSSRTSTLNHSRRSSGQRRSGSNVGGSRTSGKRPVVKTSSRRTSQVLINKTLNTNRSKKSRIQPIEESPSSDNFATPGSVGVKRKATLKGLKDLLTGSSPRQSKRGKAAPIAVSESDSDFATPSQPEPKRGKRKLHKSQISTPELIPPPERPGLRDVVPDTPDTETKITRSRTKLIQEHLSGKNLRKTRSRATRI